MAQIGLKTVGGNPFDDPSALPYDPLRSIRYGGSGNPQLSAFGGGSLADILSSVVNPQLAAMQPYPNSGNPELTAMVPPPTSGNPQLSAMVPPPISGNPQLSAMVPPSPRPTGTGGRVSSSRPSASPSARPQAQAQAQIPRSPFTQVTAQNSDPTARYRPQISALDLSGLFGGGGRSAPAAPAAPASAGFQYPSPQDLSLAGAAQAPSMDDYDLGSQLLAALRSRVR
jgi:hypothetical protein